MSRYIVHDELYHHGILGQKWGVRRYQNSDGSLTAQGKKRYGGNSYKELTPEGKKKYKTDVAITKKLRRSKKNYEYANAHAEKYRKMNDLEKGARPLTRFTDTREKAIVGLNGGKLSEKSAYKLHEKAYGKKLNPDDFVKGYNSERKKMASNFVEKQKGERVKNYCTEFGQRAGMAAVVSLATVPTLGLVILPNIIPSSATMSKYKIKE
jgi:hypothetical protein